MISPALIAGLLNMYAPKFPMRTAAAIIRQESMGNSWAILDDTTMRSYAPTSYRSAVGLAHALLAQGHNLDLGIAQVNSVHLSRSVSVESMLRPGPNLAEAQAVYLGALSRTHDERRAIMAYNGSGPAAVRYAAAVIAAEHSPFVEEVVRSPLLAISPVLPTSAPVKRVSTMFATDGSR